MGQSCCNAHLRTLCSVSSWMMMKTRPQYLSLGILHPPIHHQRRSTSTSTAEENTVAVVAGKATTTLTSSRQAAIASLLALDRSSVMTGLDTMLDTGLLDGAWVQDLIILVAQPQIKPRNDKSSMPVVRTASLQTWSNIRLL